VTTDGDSKEVEQWHGDLVSVLTINDRFDDVATFEQLEDTIGKVPELCQKNSIVLFYLNACRLNGNWSETRKREDSLCTAH
jgi:hypothetical protein